MEVRVVNICFVLVILKVLFLSILNEELFFYKFFENFF